MEEGINVLGLVVGPDGRIIALAARGVHISALGLADALARAYLGVTELGIDHVVGGVKHQILVHVTHESHAVGILGIDIGRERFAALHVSLNRQREIDAMHGLQLVNAAAPHVGADHVTTPRAGSVV